MSERRRTISISRSSTSAPNTISKRAVIAQTALLKAIKSTKPEEIESAVSEWEPLARCIPQPHPDYEPVLASYAVALLLRWEDSHQPQDIQKAIFTLEAVLTGQSPQPSSSRYQNFANLGAAYMDRYETLQKDPKDIMRAAECWQHAHVVAVALGLMRDSANKILTNLGEALFYAYEVGVAGVEAVETAIKYFTIVQTHGRLEKRASTRYKIAQCHSALYTRLKKREHLDSAIENFRASIEAELDSEERQGALMELSRTLASKYDASRDREDLEEAIKFARLAVQENQGEPWILRNLANLLYWMFKDLKDGSALDEAIDYYEVVWALYQQKPGRSMATFYYSFGTALVRRFDSGTEGNRAGKLQDIERAVDLLQLAVGSATPQCLDDYKHRLKSAVGRRDKAASNPQSHSPPSTMRSSNTVSFPSNPGSPVTVSFSEQQMELPKRSSTLRRAPIPSLSSQPETFSSRSSNADRTSKNSDSQQSSRSSQAPSETTFTPMRRGQTAPSLLSESMSIMSVPAVQNLPSLDQQQARPRVLRRAIRTNSIPAVPLATLPIPTKIVPVSPEKSRRDFLSFARLRSRAT